MLKKEDTYFIQYLLKYWKLAVLTSLLGVVSLPLSLLSPYLAKVLIDKAYGGRNMKVFLITAAIGGAVFLLTNLISSVNAYLMRKLSRQMHFDITYNLFRHLQNLPLSFFHKYSTGEFVYRVTSDTMMVSNFFSSSISQVFMFVPRMLFLIAIVFYLNWKMAIFSIILVPLPCIQPYFFGKWIKEITRNQITKTQGVFMRLQEVFSHIYLVKSMGCEKKEIASFAANFAGSVDQELKSARVAQISGFSSTALNKLLGGLITLYGGYLVLRGSMTLGSLTAVTLYLMQLIGLSRSIGEWYQDFTVNAVARNRLMSMFEVQPVLLDCKGAVDLCCVNGEIEFKDVSFAYRPDAPVFENLSFSIRGRKPSILVGGSGMGKTTIFSLILRLCQPSSGSILIDGVDITQIKLSTLRAQIGIALQNPFLWNDTVEYNIKYGSEEATEKEMIAAARLAEADGFIRRLPQGYRTSVGEMACALSEGQKQRLALARALIKKPRIILLDEALSSIDSETENKILENIRSALSNSTIVMVSHRLSAVKNAEKVYFLESPSVVRNGTHAELREKHGRYRAFFGSQMNL